MIHLLYSYLCQICGTYGHNVIILLFLRPSNVVGDKSEHDKTALKVVGDKSEHGKTALKIVGDKPEHSKTALKGFWCPPIYFNHQCYSASFLRKQRLEALPQFIGSYFVTTFGSLAALLCLHVRLT